MINLIVWCMLTVSLDGEIVDTAVKGKVISENTTYYLIDFSEYATDKKYIGDYSSRSINKDSCINEKR